MEAATTAGRIESLWNEERAAQLDEVDRLVYRSNLLGSDVRVTNFGGGNTSSKVLTPDPLTGEQVEVLWVKGSGGDLRSMVRSGLASLYQQKVLSLEELVRRLDLNEDDVVGLYSHCTFALNPVAASIDTPLHAFVPYRHVDHMHPDSVIAIAAAEDAERLTEEAFGGDVGFLSWKRPGFDLGLMLRDLIRSRPGIKGAVLESHGLINWADDDRECYELTLSLINRAQTFIDRAGEGRVHAFGDVVRPARAEPSSRRWFELLPKLRGMVSFEGLRLIAHVDQSETVLDFMSRAKLEALSKLGTSCPDHFLRTKIAPLVLPSAAVSDDGIDASLSEFRRGYAAYYDRCRHQDSPAIRNPNPSVVLIPELGMVTFGKNKREAEITAEFYCRAVEVMRGAETLSRYRALPEQEAFDIEYWLLEEAKLRRQPPEREMSRQIAVITGAAQGIGLATAQKLAQLGASVVLADISEEKLQAAVQQVKLACGQPEQVLGMRADVTSPSDIESLMRRAVLEYGGIDCCVISAGNARRGSVAETSDADYVYQSDLLMKATFETMRAATQVMIRQNTGGNLVFVGSKNGVATGSNAAVYSAAKAFGLHLMRTAAVDLAKFRIRSNAINPDAVLEGSGIWSDTWRTQTAKSLGIEPDQLEEHYRKRSMLGLAVRPSDCAEAIAWLASEVRSSRTTGCVIPVDGGNREGFLR